MKRSSDTVATMSNAPKKIRSQPPDVTIAVGRGDAMQEFEAHKVALSFASPHFDAMLSMETKECSDGRIEFPDKDPEEWKLFYRCIDPSRMSAAKPDPIITAENAKTLIPWFHEFQMDSYKEEADKILFDELRSQSKMEPSRVTEADLVLVFKPRLGPKETPLPPMRSFWNKYVNSDITTRKETFANIIESLQFACLYGLKQTKLEAERSISGLLNYMLWETMDLFDQSIIKVLVDLFLPLVELKHDDIKHYASRGESSVLWDYINGDSGPGPYVNRPPKKSSFKQMCLQNLSPGDINNNKMLAALVESYIRNLVTRVIVSLKVMVEGSGVFEINGVYTQAGSCDGVPMYCLATRYEGWDREFCLFRCKRTDNTR